MPELTWPEKTGMIVLVLLLVTAIFVYHAWLDRRLAREREKPVAGPTAAPRVTREARAPDARR